VTRSSRLLPDQIPGTAKAACRLYTKSACSVYDALVWPFHKALLRKIDHMIAALDADYTDRGSSATIAAVVFECWEAEQPVAEHIVEQRDIQPYVPGEFYRRELPGLLAVLNRIEVPLEAILIDGYVWLGDKPGLGARLWDAVANKTPIVGIAKTRYRSAGAIEVIRGRSKTPLFVTAAGFDIHEAANNVARMAGSFRLLTMLKRVDQLARGLLSGHWD